MGNPLSLTGLPFSTHTFALLFQNRMVTMRNFLPLKALCLLVPPLGEIRGAYEKNHEPTREPSPVAVADSVVNFYLLPVCAVF